MKKLIAILAIVTGIGFITPTESSARDRQPRVGELRVIGRHSCGEPLYAKYTVMKRDRHGHIVDSLWLKQPHRCSYDRGRDGHHHDHDHDRGRDRDRRSSGLRFFFGR